MPELPEVEVVRRGLETMVLGRRIDTVTADGPRSVRRHPDRTEFAGRLEGRTVTGVRRRGKYLLGILDDGGVLVAHLGMSGQLRWTDTAGESMAKHTHVVITFTTGGQLRFVDPRTFGELFVTTSDPDGDDPPELAHLGVEPLEATTTGARFDAMLTDRRAKLKPLLMDQRFIAGIGNIYSDEILWGAGIRGDRTSDSLSTEEIRRLYGSMVETLRDAVEHGGSSLADEQYVDLFGRPGRYQHCHKVYGRAGEACPRCGHVVVRERWSNRSTFSCSACQT